ncbi:NAD(P)H-binding protein [Nocardia grenadensis]|uniref:NAD(P)H-binding protein n=1 Tax=Nocardia grenadensis TaxID=931537 RepID=UPI0007A42523|nr:NAD(P)H-binding protein [Nocardia grenadensis]
MRLGIFGTTGGTGGHLIQQVLVAGRDVRAIVRDPAGAEHPGLDVRTGDAKDPDAIGPAVTGPGATAPARGSAARTAPAEPTATGRSIGPMD